MENVLCLLGGAVLGAIIGISLNRNDRQVKKLLHRILDRLPDDNEDEKVKELAGKLKQSTDLLKKAVAENTSLKT